MYSTHQKISLGGIVVDLMDQPAAVKQIIDHALSPEESVGPLSVVSANLDHIVQFGNDSRWRGVLGDSTRITRPLRPGSDPEHDAAERGMHWLTLLDGAPLVAQANQITKQSWPRLAGSDLIGPILDAAEQENLSVGFLGGQPRVQQQLAATLPVDRPRLKVSGFWAPSRADIENPQASFELAEQIRISQTDILVVGLGKPRQELWMASYGALTGAKVLLAFGAVVDFLAGVVKRSPAWVSDNGLEWAWRLSLEPRRLAQRYLVNDPPGLLKIRRERAYLTGRIEPREIENLPQVLERLQTKPGKFCSAQEHADVSILIVTFNNADSIQDLIDSLRSEAQNLHLRVVVSDNGSRDETLSILKEHEDVLVLENRANLGYAGGINMARTLIGDCDAVLVLNPDLTVSPGAIAALTARMRRSAAGIVVPKLLESDGTTYVSLRREPSLTRALGDALFGAKLSSRPGWTTEIEFDPESYAHPHQIDWATGAALLIDAKLEQRLGSWDEQFFLYSEETDYFHRARSEGAKIWYEPAAVMTHQMGGSGASLELNALMAVNRVRYARKHGTPRHASTFHALVALHHAARRNKPAHQGLFSRVADENSWQSLPTGTQPVDGGAYFPHGTVIIPAHNEAKVIARTLTPLAPLAAAGTIEVIVACNGCTDNTADIARSFAGVRVIESTVPSKVAALNLADESTEVFPRLYLDADITLTVSALRMTFERLNQPGALSARPAFEYDTTGAAWPVRSFYRARRRLPSTNSALWGAGAYAMSASGRARFEQFPEFTGDDLFVDLQFGAEEKQIVPSIPVKVSTPRTVQALLGILRRNYRGQAEMSSDAAVMAVGPGTLQTARELARSIAGPRSAFDAAVYAGMVVSARLKNSLARTTDVSWERDETSRG
ncbi:WecB/TagA/CpsF family glycosyltransferase [Glutamicibacter soli]